MTAASNPSAGAVPWQLAIYEKSLKKKEKVALLDGLVPLDGHRSCLEIGCAKGTVSHFLRRRGGRWVLRQYNLTVPVPNDLMAGVAQQIRTFLDAERRK